MHIIAVHRVCFMPVYVYIIIIATFVGVSDTVGVCISMGVCDSESYILYNYKHSENVWHVADVVDIHYEPCLRVYYYGHR